MTAASSYADAWALVGDLRRLIRKDLRRAVRSETRRDVAAALAAIDLGPFSLALANVNVIARRLGALDPVAPPTRPERTFVDWLVRRAVARLERERLGQGVTT